MKPNTHRTILTFVASFGTMGVVVPLLIILHSSLHLDELGPWGILGIGYVWTILGIIAGTSAVITIPAIMILASMNNSNAENLN